VLCRLRECCSQALDSLSLNFHQMTESGESCGEARRRDSDRIDRRREIRAFERTVFPASYLTYHVSPYGLISTLNDHAELGWLAMCQASSAIPAGAMKKSSGLFLKRSRAQGTSITASMTM
jgi:hypothetical protein